MTLVGRLDQDQDYQAACEKIVTQALNHYCQKTKYHDLNVLSDQGILKIIQDYARTQRPHRQAVLPSSDGKITFSNGTTTDKQAVESFVKTLKKDTFDSSENLIKTARDFLKTQKEAY